ncbi:HicA-like toxin [Mycobacterium phage IdentityCrisis]|uniref:HicA-like toxin n=1 Tax=Mycobacterium phage IdentityCrisis TaxID=2599866 RepID=A0A5J6TGH4_9CAUD|nr:HicA-like toxin [Mycobacterium phage IdentityCrisis]QFG10053.1 HicA-like toxin [Mycobacterium phage IdentityCrisis]
MIAPAPTREIVKQLKAAGFTSRDGKGSHTVWTCGHGRYTVSVDTGNRTISPGVRRQVDRAIDACATDCSKEV